MDRKIEIQARMWELRQISDKLQDEYSKLFAEWKKLAEEEKAKEKE